MMYKILIVEDDFIIARAMEKHIMSWGYEVRVAHEFSDILGMFVAYDPQLVLMDISLPFYNGYHWCAEIRKVSKVPVMFISSASDNMNIVMAINMGADDFVAKPFDLDVLAAKVQALLRRTYDFVGQTALLECGGAILDIAAGYIEYKGERLELTKNEHRILKLLFENKGRTVSREAIMTKLWESDSFVDDNTLTVNMTRLRKKLETVGLDELIVTKKGMGYIVGGI